MPHREELSKALNEVMQNHAFEVSGALVAHAEWKRMLRDAVERGFCEHGSDEAGRDDRCALGRWLHAMPPAYRGDAWFEQVVELHARFHREASVIVQLLEMGRIDEARTAMHPESDFARTSDDLVCLLEAWRNAA